MYLLWPGKWFYFGYFAANRGIFFGDVLDLDVMPAEVPELDFRDFPLKLSVEFSKTQNHQE